MGEIGLKRKNSFFSQRNNEIFLILSIVFIIFLCSFLNLASITAKGRYSGIYIKQILWFGLGLFTFSSVLFLDKKRIKAIIVPFYAAILLLLIFVLFKGIGTGAKRWLNLGPINFQPSEFAKAATVLALCLYIEKVYKGRPLNFKNLIVPILIAGVPAFLIALEPDIGTGFVVLSMCGLLTLIIGVQKRVVIIFLSLSIIAAPVIWKYGLREYQKRRIKVFLFPEEDPLGAGYQSVQSKITVGSGGIWGKGYKKGTQTKLKFLPEQHTDFAFSVWAEEWGFAGVIFIISLYFILVLFYIDGASRSKSLFSFLSEASVAIYFLIHLLLNLGMVTGILPVVGIPLPLFSYGGSSIVTTLFLISAALVFKD